MKKLHWVASSKKDLLGFPSPVVRNVGYALDFAQRGEKSDDAVPMRGFGGASVLEIRDNFSGDTYRAVYTVRFTRCGSSERFMCCTAFKRNRIRVSRQICRI